MIQLFKTRCFFKLNSFLFYLLCNLNNRWNVLDVFIVIIVHKYIARVASDQPLQASVSRFLHLQLTQVRHSLVEYSLV